MYVRQLYILERLKTGTEFDVQWWEFIFKDIHIQYYN